MPVHWFNGRLAIPWLLAGAAWFASPGCAPDAGPAESSAVPGDRIPVVLIGIDGLEWSVLAPLLCDGRLPNLRRLIEGGACGRLFTLKPTFSPAIWTSIATGKPPEEHGIVHFVAPDLTPLTSSDRRTKALWNIASDFGRDVLCVGWWMTWPAEEIRGSMVAPFSSGGQDPTSWKGNLRDPAELPDQTWPRELIHEVFPVARRAADPLRLERRKRELFGPAAFARSKTEVQLVEQTGWSLAADDAFLAVATHLLDRAPEPPDLTLVYFGAPDVASHRFWCFRHPDRYRFPIDDESIAAYAGVIDAFYEDADRRVGELLRRFAGPVRVLVCSDHGFHEYETDTPSRLGISGHHMDGPPGVVILNGPGVRAGLGAGAALEGGGELEDLGRIYDVAPLVLRWLGIPAGRDMASPDGGALAARCLVPGECAAAPDPLPTHDEGYAAAERPSVATEEAAAGLRAWMEQLGYLQGTSGDRLFEEVRPGG